MDHLTTAAASRLRAGFIRPTDLRATPLKALAAVLDWSTERYGVTHFLVAVPARGRDPDVDFLVSDERR